MNKRQVWLRQDQWDLVIACLHYSKLQLAVENGLTTAGQKMACHFTQSQIDEILTVLPKKKESGVE